MDKQQVDEILADYDKGFDKAISVIIKRLRRCIDVTNTLPEQQKAYKEMLSWIEAQIAIEEKTK